MSQVTKKNNKVLGLYGAGGHGRESMNQILKLIENNDLDFYKTNIYFIESQKKYQQVNDIQVLSLDEFCNLDHHQKYFNISVADHTKRKMLANKCLNKDLIPISIHSKLSSVGSNNAIDIGSLISEFSIITTNSRIGRFLHLNRYASISHDCIIGDFVTFGPYASCNGNVQDGGVRVRQQREAGIEERELLVEGKGGGEGDAATERGAAPARAAQRVAQPAAAWARRRRPVREADASAHGVGTSAGGHAAVIHGVVGRIVG